MLQLCTFALTLTQLHAIIIITTSFPYNRMPLPCCPHPHMPMHLRINLCCCTPTTTTFSCALCPSQPCPSTTELSPYPTTLPSHQQPHVHIHDPFFITWVGLKGTINNFIKATRSYVWMDRNKVGVLSMGSVEVVVST